MPTTDLLVLLEARDELLFADAPGQADLDRLGWPFWPLWEAGTGVPQPCPC